MELAMYTMGSLKTMEVIDIVTGTRLGYIRDIVIDQNQHRIVSIVLPSKKMSWFGKNEDLELPWEKIKKIGVDVILVDGSDLALDSKE